MQVAYATLASKGCSQKTANTVYPTIGHSATPAMQHHPGFRTNVLDILHGICASRDRDLTHNRRTHDEGRLRRVFELHRSRQAPAPAHSPHLAFTAANLPPSVPSLFACHYHLRKDLTFDFWCYCPASTAPPSLVSPLHLQQRGSTDPPTLTHERTSTHTIVSLANSCAEQSSCIAAHDARTDTAPSVSICRQRHAHARISLQHTRNTSPFPHQLCGAARSPPMDATLPAARSAAA
jgi:hypothetical protein